MKHVIKLLLVPLLALFSCSQADDVWEEYKLPQPPETHVFGVTFSRASLQAFAEAGITEVGIYAYLKDSLVFGKNLPLNDGKLEIDLPLGENLQTFAIANASQMIDADSLSTATVRMDAEMQSLVYLSEIVDFTSDKSVASLNLELKRLVGQAVFRPEETEEILRGITRFNRLNLTFTNAGVAYKIKSGTCVQEDVTVTVGQDALFTTSIYSLPTINGDLRTSVDVVYLNGDTEINRTNSPLDTGIAFEPSKRAIVNMPILDEDYLENPF